MLFMETNDSIAFRVINWPDIEKIIQTGAGGKTYTQTLQLAGWRVRVVEYPPGYLADHWCSKGHLVNCISGSFRSELQTGEAFTLTAGMSYMVSDNMSAHRSSTIEGVKLFIFDGDFIK